MFSFTNKKVTDIWNSEVDTMKKISKMADFQGTASGCITTRVRIRHGYDPALHTVVFPWSEQAVQAENI